MKRRPLLDAIAAYARRHPDERDTTDRFRAFVEAYEDCFERSLAWPGHVTGSAWIVSPERDAVLLTHHRKLDLWIQLGGHADGNPDPLDVALVEGLEESGLPSLTPLDAAVPFDLDIHRIPARRDEPEHEHFDVRYAFLAPHRDYVVSDESHDLAWVPIEDLSSYTKDESVLRMAQKWRRRG
ncbi:MAG: NUDIX hydrolase [Pseudomonadales bacterium]|nr:NUDIX hydrolase [Pseudomonadales bacterium]